jgi:hypothetical protein
MGGCINKPSATAVSSPFNLLSNNSNVSFAATLNPPLSHPNRLVEFKDDDMERVMAQFSTEQSIRMNSLQFDHREFHRRPDALAMKLVTGQILSEVENALVKSLSEGLYLILKDSGASMSYNAAQFKNTNMKQSELSPAIIEAALTLIIEHLDQHSRLIDALGDGKIGYHDKGAMLNDRGVRMFVIEGSEKANNAK